MHANRLMPNVYRKKLLAVTIKTGCGSEESLPGGAGRGLRANLAAASNSSGLLHVLPEGSHASFRPFCLFRLQLQKLVLRALIPLGSGLAVPSVFPQLSDV